MERDIFTGVFLVEPVLKENKAAFALSKHHVTYHYQPGNCAFPQDVEEDDWIKLDHIGIYDDGEILASLINLKLREGDTTNRTLRNQLRRYDEDGNELPGFPLHITWSSGELPPVVAGERLNDADCCDQYLTYVDPVHEYKFNRDVLKENDLDINDPAQRDTYSKRIEHIFSYFTPIGIWKRFKIPVESED